MKPVVKILVSCPNPDWIDACTWVFKSLRTGFPTSAIEITLNKDCIHPSIYQEVFDRVSVVRGALIVQGEGTTHHAGWIADMVKYHSSEAPLVILDSDTYFWSSVEDWQFNTLVAGHYIPEMWNDFAGCRSVPRIHTSFMWFSDVPALRGALHNAYPQAFDKTGAYSPCDPFMPATRFVAGQALFWDTCANMFAMLQGTFPLSYFNDSHFKCYEHLNSASFFDTMKERLPDGANFEKLHREWLKSPEFLRGKLWPTTHAYYRAKQLQGHL